MIIAYPLFGAINTMEFWGPFLSTVVLSMVVFGTWLFFFLHAMQRIDDPVNRMSWALCFIGLNLFCLPFYVVLKYIPFKRNGKGWLIRAKDSK